MSMTMMALRIAAVEALRAGGTLVGDNVLDSQISALDHTADGQLTSDQQRPFIAVYSDAARARDLAQTGLRANGQVELVFNFGVSMTMAETDRASGEARIVEGFPATDADFEAVLDVLDVQICRALSDPENPWAMVFGGFVQAYLGKDHIRSGSAAEHVRLAAGQIRLQIEVFADPRVGQPMDDAGPWARFLSLLEAGGHGKAPLFRQLLGAPDQALYPPFERLASMTTRQAGALKLHPYQGVAADVTVSAAEGVVARGG